MARFRARLTYANVMSTMAVFIALGGSALAGGVLQITSKNVPKNALTGADIRNITGKDVKKNSLTGKHVKKIKGQDVTDGSLRAKDIGGGLPAGPQGPPGQDASLTGAAGGDLTGNYPNPTIAGSAVNGGKLAADAVSTSKIADDAVINAKIGNDAVNNAKIADNAVAIAEIADNAVSGVEIVDASVLNADLADNAVNAAKIEDGTVFSAEIADDTGLGGGLAAADLRSDSVGSAEIQTDSVGATEVANDSIDSGEVVDFGLSNQDIGVLFAEVNADGTLANSSGGGVTTTDLGASQYEVDFARNVTACTAVATIGRAEAVATTTGEILVADRGGNAEAVFVDTNDSTGAASDRPFRLVVVC